MGYDKNKKIAEGGYRNFMDSTKLKHLKQFTRSLIGKAKQNLEKDKELSSVVFFMLSDDVHILPVSLKTEQDRQILEFTIKVMVKELKPMAVVFLTDGWSVQSKTGVIEGTPSTHPERKECISISVVTKTYRSWGLLQFYSRKDGRIHFEELQEVESLFCGFIDDAFVENRNKTVH